MVSGLILFIAAGVLLIPANWLFDLAWDGTSSRYCRVIEFILTLATAIGWSLCVISCVLCVICGIISIGGTLC